MNPSDLTTAPDIVNQFVPPSVLQLGHIPLSHTFPHAGKFPHPHLASISPFSVLVAAPISSGEDTACQFGGVFCSKAKRGGPFAWLRSCYGIFQRHSLYAPLVDVQDGGAAA